jgi:hypothetical protein
VEGEEFRAWGGPIAPPGVAELADRYALGQLARVYALGVDLRDYALARSVFADDAMCEGSSTGGPVDEYLPFIVKSVSAFAATQHNITNQYITLDGDEALVWSYAIAVHKVTQHSDRPHFNLGVSYRDTCRRFPSGWLIVKRKVVLHWSQNYAKEQPA